MEREPNRIEAEANRWVIRLDGQPLSPEEQAELDSWILRSKRHHGAFLRARAAWLHADRLKVLCAAQAQDSVGQPIGRRRMRTLFAASVCAFCVALAVLYVRTDNGETYASEIGEVRKIVLPDGSRLTLNTDTQARIEFREEERGVVLKRGEAQFTVAHDVARPFIVRVRGVRVRAVGTAFTVRVDGERVDVVVSEGVVEVSRDGDANVQRIAANYRALIASRESRLDVEPVDVQRVERELAWRDGSIIFAGEPLSVAIAEINRYSRVPIYVDDAVLAGQPVVGIFRANDPEGFAAAAAATFNAEVIRADDGFHLHRVGESHQ